MIKSYLWKNIKLFATGHQYEGNKEAEAQKPILIEQ